MGPPPRSRPVDRRPQSPEETGRRRLGSAIRQEGHRPAHRWCPECLAVINGSINSYIGANPNADYYSNDYPWLNSALVQAAQIEEENTVLYSVGIGLGTDYNFMDRMARTALTDKAGRSPRGSGIPLNTKRG